MKWAWVLVYHSRKAGTLKFQLMSLEKRGRVWVHCHNVVERLFFIFWGIEHMPQSNHPLLNTQTKEAAHVDVTCRQQDKRHPGDV